MKKIVVFVMAFLCLSSFSFGKAENAYPRRVKQAAEQKRNKEVAPYIRAIQYAEAATRESLNSWVVRLDTITLIAIANKFGEELPKFYNNREFPEIHDALRKSVFANYYVAFEPQYMTAADRKALVDFLKANPYRVNYGYEFKGYQIGANCTVTKVKVYLGFGQWYIDVDPGLKRLTMLRPEIRSTGSPRVQKYVNAK